MKIRILSAAVLAAISLTGCQTAQQRAAADDGTCRSYGAQPGSAAYIQCRSMAEQTRATNRVARATILWSED